ncbi:hypothetical protein FSP39_016706 [Pinctada imbricata]|uniref:Solute carrier family 43 member 3 n=1 Tax=Pinctada imbricata TaxID=66713 RepID=A0AA88XZD6_PINIB|nr:hypothetical protein FSP39_016706 [Pinctada imbricata]
MRDENDYSGWRKYACAGISLCECLLFCGLHYGWAPLVYVFKNEGIYGDLCEQTLNSSNLLYKNASFDHIISYSIEDCRNCSSNKNGTAISSTADHHKCKAQDDKFAMTFTVASTIVCAGCVVFGHINLKFGTRVTRILSMTIFILGALMLAFTNKEYAWLMLPGLTCLGTGGMPIFMTSVQVSNLFGKGASSFVGSLSGAFDSSAFVMLLLKIGFEHGTSRETFLIGLACLHTLVAINTFFFLPRSFITKTKLRKDIDLTIDKGENEVLTETDKKNPLADESSKPSLRDSILSPLYIMHVFWLCILQLRFYYFIGTLNPFLHKVTGRNEQLVSHFTDVFGYCILGGIFTTTFAGFVYDWQKRIFKDRKSKTSRQLLPALLPLSLGSGLSLLMSILLLIPRAEVLYLTFVVMVFMRSFLYGIGSSYLAAM